MTEENIEAIITEVNTEEVIPLPLPEEEEVLDKVLETKKPKKERTEKQKQAFEKARITRAENIKKRKEEAEKNKKPRGRPVKKKEEIPIEEPIEEEEESESSEEEIIYKKKPKKVIKKKAKKQKIVFVSDDSSDYSSSSEEEEEVKPKKTKYIEPQQVYQAPQSLTHFYKFA